MSASGAGPSRPGVGLWITTIAIVVIGLVSGLMGLLGAVFELEPAPVYDVADPPGESHYEAQRAIHAICRVDEMERVQGDDACIFPLTPHDAPLKDYAEVPLMLMASCLDMIDFVGDSAFTDERAVPCEPLGKSYTMDVHGETFETSMKARYPGFTGEVMELPTEKDIRDAKETRLVFLAMLGIGATGFLGGLAVSRIAWRRRKRAIEAGN